jgi:hypothetical protein
LLIGGSIGLLLALLTGFFGYKLARFLLPLSGLAVLEGIICIYLYDLLTLDAISTWLFFGGTGIAVYLVLFFVKRLAGFFTGLLGSALLLIFIVYAMGLHSFSLLYPVVLTLSVMAGLMTAVYKRIGVVISTSVLGGCAAAYLGLYIYLEGADMSALQGGNILIPLVGFLSSHTLLVLGVALGLTLVSLLVQLGVTAKRQVLADDSPAFTTKKKEKTDPDIWTGDMGY